jgi:phosphoenolpyruvate carboxykinase (ATP)
MLHHHHHHHLTPHVTPHIIGAGSYLYDNDENSCESLSSLSIIPWSPIPLPVLGKDLEYFSQAGFDMSKIHLRRNAPVSQLYEDAIRNEGAIISSSGALINFSGKKTGRSPKDKRIVFEETSKNDIWWGPINIKMDERMLLFLSSHPDLVITLYIVRHHLPPLTS